MLSVFALFGVISSGSLFTTSFFGKRYEESAPLSVFGLIAILYVFGLLHLLRAGVFAACVIAAALLIATIYHEATKKQWMAFFGRTLTPAFFLFLAATAAIVLITRGRLITGWDEYSHWAYIVKAMAFADDFGTNPTLHALYPGYPPAMPLLQYFTVVLNGGYAEWLLYAAFLMAATSLFLPFLKKLTHQTVALNIAVCGLIIIVPTLFFFDYYANLQVDSMLGLTFGFAMATLFMAEEKDTLSRLSVLLSIFILALLKPAGSLLALFALISFLVDVLLKPKISETLPDLAATERKNRWRWSIAGVGIFSFAELSWACCVNLNPATETLDISSMSNTMHELTNASSEIIRGFFARVLGATERFGFLRISDMALIAVFFLLLGALAFLRRGRGQTETRGKTHLLIELAVYTILYFFLVLLSYLKKFSTFDALRLASYDRYIGTIFLALAFFVFASLFLFYFRLRSKKARAAVLLAAFIALVPFAYKRAPQLLPDEQIAVTEHANYAQVVEKLNTAIQNPDADVYLIAQHTNGFEWLAFRYFLFPTHVYGYWSIGEPYSKDDVYTVSLDVSEWKQTLEASYDFLYIYQCDAAFIARYGSAFADDREIGENRLYRMNQSTHLLELVSVF